MVFQRVLVGFDGSPASVRALTAARALTADDGALTALVVAETYFATHAGMDAVAWDEEIRDAAERARAQAAELGDCTAEITTGHAAPALLRTADKLGADLVSIGAHGHGRMSGLLLGSVATRIVHDARCSVLVARGSDPLDDFPAAIVVGVDASPESTVAARVGAALARATGASIREVERRPVDGLLEASHSAGLLVVGSRGLHGLSSVRSVAERVAHEATCPVLIVRDKHAADTARGTSQLDATQA